jgi:hypothetical protein
MERKRQARTDPRAASRGASNDLLRGVILAIVIPILAFLLARALDLQGLGKGEEKQKDLAEAPPVSLEHARDMLLEVKRLYQENYGAVFVPRVERAMNSDDAVVRKEGRAKEFIGADKIFKECEGMVARLKKELARPGSELAPVAGDIQRWDEELARALERHDRLNPIPKSFRTGQ